MNNKLSVVLRVYNTLTGKKEVFKSLKSKNVKMFVCGPTVYGLSHLGHAKTYVQFDVIAKYLHYKKYKIFYLQNITDIDDKIIKKAAEEKTSWDTVARTYEKLYLEDMQKLGINSVNKYARATEYIAEIVSQVKRLIKKGYAYRISDGYYFDLSKCKDYGKLAKRTKNEAEDSVSRIDENEGKRNKGDFCLWKFSKEGEPFWETEIETGRPGWHIEDTAITEKELGNQYDIHGGGIDLIFPHHEAEIAQMESISGKVPFVRYWLHTGFVNSNNEKMSKSLGNFSTIRDVLSYYDSKVLRFLFLSTHYRNPVSFSEQVLRQAKSSLERIHDFVRNLKNYSGGKKIVSIKKRVETVGKKFEEAMDDDFETAKALTVLFDLIRYVNILMDKNKVAQGDTKFILKKFEQWNAFFGILEEKEELSLEVEVLVQRREEARRNKNWIEADRLRDEIKKKGYVLDDTKGKTIIKKI